MISAHDLISCLKNMTEDERREAARLLFPKAADLPDFSFLAGMSHLQAHQALADRSSLGLSLISH